MITQNSNFGFPLDGNTDDNDDNGMCKRKTKFGVSSDGTVAMNALCEDLRKDIRDQWQDKKKIEEENNILTGEIISEKKITKSLTEDIDKLREQMDQLNKEIEICNTEIADSESLIVHKNNTIKHQQGIISLVAENDEDIKEQYSLLKNEVITIKLEMDELKIEYSELNEIFKDQLREIENYDMDLEQDTPLVAEIDLGIRRLKHEVMRETRALREIKDARDRKERNLTLQQKAIDVLLLQRKQMELTLKEIEENILPESMEKIFKLKNQIAEQKQQRDAMRHNFNRGKKMLELHVDNFNLMPVHDLNRNKRQIKDHPGRYVMNKKVSKSPRKTTALSAKKMSNSRIVTDQVGEKNRNVGRSRNQARTQVHGCQIGDVLRIPAKMKLQLSRSSLETNKKMSRTRMRKSNDEEYSSKTRIGSKLASAESCISNETELFDEIERCFKEFEEKAREIGRKTREQGGSRSAKSLSKNKKKRVSIEIIRNLVGP